MTGGVSWIGGRARRALYRRVLSKIPRGAQTALGSSRLLRPIRDWLFRTGGRPRLFEGKIRFENLSFRFAAPLRTLHVAETKGIESRISRLAMSQCFPGAVCLDVGANYGFISLVMALSAAPHGRVFSFEPARFIFDALLSNGRTNGLEGVCRPVNAFVTDRPHPPTENAPSVSVDEFVESEKLPRVDFIKIDTDGGDAAVLRGAARTLARFHPIVVVELTSRQTREHPWIYERLRSEGYSCADTSGNAVVPPAWPTNVFASVEGLLRPPPRGSFAAAAPGARAAAGESDG